MSDDLRAVKVLSEGDGQLRVGGYGVIFGGRDVVGDYFDQRTDLLLEGDRRVPVLYQHGADAELGGQIIGQVVVKRADGTGLWVEAQLTLARKYASAIRDLIAKGVLGWSSGAVGHMVQRVKQADGRNWLERWPIGEFSLTPTPAEPRTLGVQAIKSLLAADPGLRSLLGPDGERKAFLADIEAFLADWHYQNDLVADQYDARRARLAETDAFLAALENR